jgi:hypothetical protein
MVQPQTFPKDPQQPDPFSEKEELHRKEEQQAPTSPLHRDLEAPPRFAYKCQEHRPVPGALVLSKPTVFVCCFEIKMTTSWHSKCAVRTDAADKE